MAGRRHVLNEADMDFLFRGGALEFPDGTLVAMEDVGTWRLKELLKETVPDGWRKTKKVNEPTESARNG